MGDIYPPYSDSICIISMLARKGEADCGWAGVWMDLERLLGWDKMEWTHDHNIIH